MRDVPTNERRAAVVGGSGFLGAPLSRALGSLYDEVVVLDIEPPEPEVAAVCRYVRCDVRDPEQVTRHLRGFETVYLLAGLLAKRSDEEPATAWATNIGGTVTCLNALAGDPALRRVVFFSSSMIFDSASTVFPIHEDAPKRGERLYDQSKLIGEDLLTTFCRSYGVEGLAFRFFSAYGPGRFERRKGHFIATWIDMVRNGEPLLVHGTGEQTIDLIHVDDVVQACVLGETLEVPRGAVEAFNVGSGVDTRVIDIASWILEVQPDAELRHGPGPKAAIRRRWADITRARRVLGYAPSVRPEDGVKGLARERLHPEVAADAS